MRNHGSDGAEAGAPAAKVPGAGKRGGGKVMATGITWKVSGGIGSTKGGGRPGRIGKGPVSSMKAMSKKGAVQTMKAKKPMASKKSKPGGKKPRKHGMQMGASGMGMAHGCSAYGGADAQGSYGTLVHGCSSYDKGDHGTGDDLEEGSAY